MTPKADLSLDDDDRVVIRDALLAMRKAGVDNPIIPADVDINGDGLTDGFGLDEHDEVVPVLSVSISDTCYVSEGDDVTDPKGA